MCPGNRSSDDLNPRDDIIDANSAEQLLSLPLHSKSASTGYFHSSVPSSSKDCTKDSMNPDACTASIPASAAIDHRAEATDATRGSEGVAKTREPSPMEERSSCDIPLYPR